MVDMLEGDLERSEMQKAHRKGVNVSGLGCAECIREELGSKETQFSAGLNICERPRTIVPETTEPEIAQKGCSIKTDEDVLLGKG